MNCVKLQFLLLCERCKYIGIIVISFDGESANADYEYRSEVYTELQMFLALVIRIVEVTQIVN